MQALLSKLLFLILLTPFYLHASVTAKVDQSTLYQGEKLTLTIETDHNNEHRPDLRVLQKGYTVLGTKKITLSKHSTGSVITKTRWVLLLRPTKDGEMIIPAIKVGEELSPEISLSVLPAEQNPSPSEGALRPLFLEVTLDKDELYISEQAILRARIYHLAPLPLDSNISPPESNDLLIKPLEEQKEYTTLVRGQRYTVTENSFTLFPRQEGPIEVPPVFFSATLANDSVVELNSAPVLLSVLPKTFSNNRNLWLPVKAIHIEDNLSETVSAEVGANITRIVMMEAEGLPASALPSLSLLQNELAEITLLNVVLEEKMTENGIVSQRIEELAITPIEIGEITLPAIDIPWWNTATDKGQTASLSSRTLNVLPASKTPATQSVFEQPQSTDKTQKGSGKLLIWLLTAISIIATLGCIYSFNRLRLLQKDSNQFETQLIEQQKMQKQIASEIAERNTFQAFSMACNQSNPEITQLRLIEWAQSFWNDSELHSLEQVCEYAQNQTFNFLILDLEQHLYGKDTAPWQGDLLLETIEKLRNRQHKKILDIKTGDNMLSY